MIDRMRFPGAPPGVQIALLAAIVGALTGGIAVLFRLLIALLHNLFVYGNWSFHYEPTRYSDPSPLGWGIALVPIAGGMINLWLKRLTAGGGHGVPDVILSLHDGQGNFQIGGSLLKVLATGFSSASGASVGREGASVLIGAAMSTATSRLMRLDERHRLVLLAAGAGAGIGAAFNAPIAGALFALEVLLAELSPGMLLPLLIASVSANIVERLAGIVDPEFAVMSAQSSSHASDVAGLVIYGLFGLALGVAALAFMRALDATEALLTRMIARPYLRHALAMALVGLGIAAMMANFGHFHLLGAGYATVHWLAVGADTTVGFLLLLFAAKFLATCLSLGSGATGGVFSATLYLGGALGAALGMLVAQAAPELGISAGTGAIVGMAGLLAGTTGAALFTVVLIFEITSDYAAILPVAVAAVAAIGVRRILTAGTIYTAKLRRKGFAIPESLVPDILAELPSGAHADPVPDHDPERAVTVSAETSLRTAAELMAGAGADVALVAADGRVVGAVTPATIGRILLAHAGRRSRGT